MRLQSFRGFIPVLFLNIATLLALPAWADQCIPYCNVGHIAPLGNSDGSMTAYMSGDVQVYFFGFEAHNADFVRMWDVTSNYLSPWMFNNQTTKIGTQADFGTVSKGDKLVFELWDALQNNTQPGAGYIYYTQPNRNPDFRNHFYSAPWGGGMVGDVYIPAGTYMGGEDLPYPVTDWDYNDLQFVWNISGDPGTDNVVTPEPGSLSLLLMTGICAAAALRRKIGN